MNEYENLNLRPKRKKHKTSKKIKSIRTVLYISDSSDDENYEYTNKKSIEIIKHTLLKKKKKITLE